MREPDSIVKKYDLVEGSRHAYITFENDKFSICEFNLRNPYTFEDWYFLREVANTIINIQEDFLREE